MNPRVIGPLAWVLLGYGCTPGPLGEPGEPEPAHIRSYHQDSVTVVLSVSTTNLTSAGQVKLMLDVHAPDSTKVTFPDLSHRIDAFTVAEMFTEPLRTLRNGKTRHRHVWVLIPTLPGETVLPPLDVMAGEATLETEAIAMRVTSLLPPDLEAIAIRDIAGPLDQLREQSAGRTARLVLGTGAILLIGVAVIRRLRMRRTRPIVSPREAALRALDRLQSTPCEPIAFVHQLDHIFRQFLHAHHGIPALESTHREVAGLLDEPELIGFLAHCEEIKFSHIARPDFDRTAIAFVRGYIESSTQAVPICD